MHINNIQDEVIYLELIIIVKFGKGVGNPMCGTRENGHFLGCSKDIWPFE